MDSDGGITDFLTAGVSGPDGLAMDSDGTRLFVAHFGNGSRIDEVSIPGAVLTEGAAITLDSGWYTSGIIADVGDDVLVKTQDTNAKIGGVSF